MKRRRPRRSNRWRLERIAALAVFALLIPAGINWLAHLGGALEKTGEKAAMFAAALNMPEEGLDALRDRFEDELYGGHPTAPSQLEGIPLPSEPESSESAGEEPDPEETPQRGDGAKVAPKIPEQYRALLVSENFTGVGNESLLRFGAGYIRNETRLEDEAVAAILETPFDLGFTDTDEPQVLIVHTHATEAFERYDSDYYDTRNTWRSRDNNLNMVSVGAAMAQVLEDNGIGVIHDTTQHDYPSYNGSYERSAATIQSWLEEYPTIRVVLDLHRDAMEREDEVIVKPVAVVDGQKAAQVMIIAACDDDGSMGVPEYRRNLRFAAAFQDYMESSHTYLTRPLYFCYRKYNMDLTPGSLLLEFGSNANTLEEAVYAAELAGQALADLIRDHME